MNAASRLVYQGALSKQTIFGFLLTKIQMAAGVLILTLLLSAIGVVYATYLNRVLLSELQMKEQESVQLQARYSQLVLERGVYLTESRIEKVAKQKLAMVLPSHSRVVIVNQ